MKWRLVFLSFVIVASPVLSHADFISAGNAGAIIVTDNGKVFAPGHPTGIAIATAPASSAPVVIKDGSVLVVPRAVKVIPARSFSPNFTGVNSLLGTPGPGNGPLLGTPGPGTNMFEPRKHHGFPGRHFRK